MTKKEHQRQRHRRFAPGDPVRFKRGGQTMDGIVIDLVPSNSLRIATADNTVYRVSKTRARLK